MSKSKLTKAQPELGEVPLDGGKDFQYPSGSFKPKIINRTQRFVECNCGGKLNKWTKAATMREHCQKEHKDEIHEFFQDHICVCGHFTLQDTNYDQHVIACPEYAKQKGKQKANDEPVVCDGGGERAREDVSGERRQPQSYNPPPGPVGREDFAESLRTADTTTVDQATGSDSSPRREGLIADGSYAGGRQDTFTTQRLLEANPMLVAHRDHIASSPTNNTFDDGRPKHDQPAVALHFSHMNLGTSPYVPGTDTSIRGGSSRGASAAYRHDVRASRRSSPYPPDLPGTHGHGVPLDPRRPHRGPDAYRRDNVPSSSRGSSAHALRPPPNANAYPTFPASQTQSTAPITCTGVGDNQSRHATPVVSSGTPFLPAPDHLNPSNTERSTSGVGNFTAGGIDEHRDLNMTNEVGVPMNSVMQRLQWSDVSNHQDPVEHLGVQLLTNAPQQTLSIPAPEVVTMPPTDPPSFAAVVELGTAALRAYEIMHDPNHLVMKATFSNLPNLRSLPWQRQLQEVDATFEVLLNHRRHQQSRNPVTPGTSVGGSMMTGPASLTSSLLPPHQQGFLPPTQLLAMQQQSNPMVRQQTRVGYMTADHMQPNATWMQAPVPHPNPTAVGANILSDVDAGTGMR